MDEEQTLVTERPNLHPAPTLSDTPVAHLHRPFDSGSAVGVATQAASEAKARAADVGHAVSQETSKAAPASSNVRAKEGGAGRGFLAVGALLLTLGAVALAFYVGMMFERKGMSSRFIPTAATPQPSPTPATAAPRPAENAFTETPAERFLRLRSAVDLSPATEAARMSTESNGQPLDSTDPEFLYLYGRALLLSDRQPEAAAAFDRAIQRINENMTPANGELKIDARLAKVAAHLRARDDAAARQAADALSEIVRPQQTPTAATEPGTVPTP